MSRNQTGGCIAIVDGGSLLARELQELIKDRKFRCKVQLLSGDPGQAAFAVQDEEAELLAPLTRTALLEADVVFLTGPGSAKARELCPEAKFLDLAGMTHPAAVALAFVLSKMPAVEWAVATVFEPASERGRAGIGELQKQTANLLSFLALPKAVFDTQAAFNMLPAYGAEAPVQLAAVEDRIVRDLGALSRVPVSVRVVHAPVFHGYSVQLYARLSSVVDSLDAYFADDEFIDLRHGDTEPPSNAGCAQQDGYQIGGLQRDRRDPNAWWIFVAFDNLRLLAARAVAAAEEML